MVVRRLAAAILLLALVAGVAWWLQDGPMQAPADLGRAGSYQVRIVGADNGTFWEGTVNVPGPATPLSALQMAARAGNFTVEVVGSVQGAYVRSIGPYTETAASGWTYWVRTDKGFTCIHQAADKYLLPPAARIEWRWADPDGTC